MLPKHFYVALSIIGFVFSFVLGIYDKGKSLLVMAALTGYVVHKASRLEAQKQANNSVQNDSQEESALYLLLQPNIRDFKVLLQMAGGIGLIYILVTKLTCNYMAVGCFNNGSALSHLHSLGTLKIVSLALSYSSGIELAYMLFTPGPDEAVTPLIIGIAATALYSVSNIDYADQYQNDLGIALAVGILVLSIVLLFFIKFLFFEEDRKVPKSIFDRILIQIKTRFLKASDDVKANKR